MKKYKLKKWVKVVLSVIVFLLSVVIYKDTGSAGALAQNNNLWLSICILEWSYLFFIQFLLYKEIWEN